MKVWIVALAFGAHTPLVGQGRAHPRPIQTSADGSRIVAFPEVGGLHTGTNGSLPNWGFSAREI